MIVIDASALAKYLMGEEGWTKVSEYIKDERPLYSVDHVVKECANALWKHTYLTKRIRPPLAVKLFEGLLGLIETRVIILEEESKYIKRALEIALGYGITIYDALYIAQAERIGELITSDEKQSRVASLMGITVHYIE